MMSPTIAEAERLVIGALATTHVKLTRDGRVELDRFEVSPGVGVIAPWLALRQTA
jgi:hypothetical protein